MINIGELNRRLLLEAPAESDDGAGGVIRLYEVVTTVWGQVTPVAVRTDATIGGFGAVLQFRIVIRARDDITTRHRLLDGAHIYSVIAARPSADLRFLEIDAEERQD